MLLYPQRNERLGDPAPDRGQAVQPGMAACTQCDEQSNGVLPRLPVMDVEALPRPAGPATASVPFEDGFAVPREM